MIRLAKLSDSGKIAEIYNHYILNTTANFEEEAVTAEIMSFRIEEVQRSYPWLVYETMEGQILGYAYASGWKSRCGYRQTVETSVYLKKDAHGQGIGSALYDKLLRLLVEMKIHAVIGGIALPNAASVKLHEKFGFEKVAHFIEVGKKFGEWIDVGYWEKILV
jgi:phosphinothricin acetyltransferase